MEISKSCEVCRESRHKYTCPGCKKKTCSLPCVKKHKEETDCNGRRDKTAYVKMAKFDDLQLLNDYRFLEDVDRVVDRARRDFTNNHKTPVGLTKFQKKMVRIAKQNDITLSFLPRGSTKRTKNRLYVLRVKELNWFIEWKFVDADVTITQFKVDGTKDLISILRTELDSEKFDPVIRFKLKSMLDVPMNEWVVLLKAEREAAKYHLIDINESLYANLTKKVIIEYPTFHVCLPKTAEQYQKIGQAETCEESESGESEEESSEEDDDKT